ncbi:RraA family protein [Streptomyces iranensis]|uniref:Putative 4-hydroxy-4-methyl-2-oxoglutarate aldolase n=1 Tax=Streptomyces iranensis TaxID=576784 RepID=A0A061A5W7_9ACTN|nr:RraA family protein [Streptomyces iranensis]MBP2063649.1 regulator of RNase E activity RraA [Streptomyces iranensis]CDR17759.1 Dimethylmenaquinone methyltransferase [Streptomyces iranensis]
MEHPPPPNPSDAAEAAPDPAWDLLTSALASDALDALGRRRQCLGPDIRPLGLAQRVVGRAHTVHAVAAAEVSPARPYEGLLSALDHTAPGTVFVFHTGRSDAAGVWGELVTTACLSRQVAGALTDGLIRDVSRVQALGFPVFSRGATPYDSKGRVDVVEELVPVTIDGVRIDPGDLIVGDADGVCVVPAELEEKVISLVREKRAGEREFREAVARGVPVTDAFRTYRVL